MSVQLRVELPAYTLSFFVTVEPTATVLDVKHEIAITCVGQPRAEGQRLVWRGRYLKDAERIDELWKSPEEAPIVHLSVHPSAWASAPPQIPTSQAFTPVLPPVSTPAPPRRARTPASGRSTTSSRATATPAFILYKHQNALIALLEGKTLPSSNPDSIQADRSAAEIAVARAGFSWPAILDEEFPADDTSSDGVKYECVAHEGQTYLKLCTPDATPTALQIHAMKVLTYTFPLLSLPTPVSTPISVVSTQAPIPPHMNMLLQQLGLPALRGAQAPAVQHNGAGAALQINMPRIPWVPFMMISLRTLVMLYFINPLRKPWLSIVLVLWMVYDFAAPFLGAFRAAAAQQANAQNGAQGVPPAAGAAQPGAPGVVPFNAPAGGGNQAEAILQTLANTNLGEEERALAAPGAARPRIGTKLALFLSLLLTTVHPAVWDRRRAALRRREGVIRTEANAREAQVPENDPATEGEGVAGQNVENDRTRAARDALVAQHALRPHWVREYIERVCGGDWVDESD